MKKILVAICTALFLCGLVHAEMTVSQWMSVLAETDSTWREGYETYVQESLAAKDWSDSWLPMLTATPGYSLTKTGTSETAEFSQTASLGLSLSQKLPTGGSLSATISQSLSTENIVGEAFGYQTSGSISLSQPIFYGNSRTDRELKRTCVVDASKRLAGESRWRAAQLRRTADTLSQFLNTIILIERQKLRKELIDWYSTSLENDRILFEAGQLSSLEYAEARTDSASVESAYIQFEMVLVEYLDDVKIWGLGSENVDLETWLNSIERDLDSSQSRTAVQWELDAERYAIGASLENTRETELADLPTLSMKYSCTPGASSADKTDAWSAVSDYWSGELAFNGSFSISVTIPLTPWDSVWKTSRTGASRRRSFQVQCAEIDRKLASYAVSSSKLTELHDLAASQSLRTYLLEKDRLDLYTIRAGNGDISELDVRYQAIQAENARLDWYVARIARITSLLTGD